MNEVDKEFETRLSAELPVGFDPASLIALIMGIFADCFKTPDHPTPAAVVGRVKNLSLVQRGALTNKLIAEYMDDGLTRKEARQKAKTGVAALTSVASKSSDADQLAAAQRALEVSGGDYQWI